MTYPKFKLGEEVVREVPVPPTYGKIYHLMTNMYVLYKTVCNTDTEVFSVINCQSGIIPAISFIF